MFSARSSRPMRRSVGERRLTWPGHPTRPASALVAGRRVARRRPGPGLTAAAPLVPIALDLACQFVRAEVDRVLEIPRSVARPQDRALDVQRNLGDVAIRIGGVALLP